MASAINIRMKKVRGEGGRRVKGGGDPKKRQRGGGGVRGKGGERRWVIERRGWIEEGDEEGRGWRGDGEGRE